MRGQRTPRLGAQIEHSVGRGEQHHGPKNHEKSRMHVTHGSATSRTGTERPRHGGELDINTRQTSEERIGGHKVGMPEHPETHTKPEQERQPHKHDEHKTKKKVTTTTAIDERVGTCKTKDARVDAG